jgi:predicted RNase H-like HicB family nuclease
MNETVVQIQANIQWQVMQTPANHYVGVCEPMNLSMEASSLDELQSLINETLQLMFEDLLHDNELDAYLREHGWQAKNIPVGQFPADVKFEVPWEMTMSTSGDSMRRSYQSAA